MNKVIIGILVVAVIAVGGYFLLKSPQYQAPNSNLAPQSTSQGTVPTVPTPTTQAPVTQGTPPAEQNVVTYTNAGYSPNTITIKAGETVNFRNNSSQSMWTASDVHPTHTVYGGTSLGAHCPDITKTAFDTCAGIQPGNSWRFTFTKKGTWKYHNHLVPSNTGTVVVE